MTPSQISTIAAAPALHYLALFSVIVGLLVVIPKLLHRIGKQKKAPGLKQLREEISKAESDTAVRRATDKALVDLLETSREISAQIDMKIRILNKLVKDAERQSKRLENLLGIAETIEEASELNPDYKPLPESSGTGRENLQDEPKTPSGRFRSSTHKRIADLRSQGLNATEIAKNVRLSLHEVNMVLHMLGSEE